MNILYVCHRFPYPPKRGGKIRPFNMIRHLTEQGHRVWVCSLVRNEQEAEETVGIEQFCEAAFMAAVDNKVQTARMVARLPLTTPSSMGYFYSAKLQRHINTLLKQEAFDLIFVHCSSVAQYVTDVTGIPKILDFGDMDSQKWLSYVSHKPFPLNLGYWLEGTKLEAEEKRLARQFDLCTCTTRAEWQTLKDYATGVDTDWFPNGVDSSFFAPDGGDYDPHAISFIGRMDYYPNQQCMLSFCRDTLPLIQQQDPEAKLFIVGADPSKEIQALGELPGVTVTGSVDDVRPYVRRTAAMVAPLTIARGTQNKILEAMAMGVPVVTSTAAAGGIDAVPGDHFLQADSPQATAAALLQLMQNACERQRLAEAGRERVLEHHNWAASMRRLDAIIAKCVSYPPMETTAKEAGL
ncbi:TIGR03087 family PEP-CTERM/XrtA system glycosyltransferase [Motiliproteus sediminis]|uniref:TIGR03087 family PEP-CTERM/XrtA system glycosyltransferase n=1 Tax=Motiliproteus sediminis TaxID=1468178 RepID=UPI001AF027F5